MQHCNSSIKIVDNLAEITSHHDRQLLEKSLLKTLNELFPNQGLRLFRVRKQAFLYDISLLAYCVNGVIASTDTQLKLSPEAEELSAAMMSAIEKEDVVMIDADGSQRKIIYPAFDSNGDIFALLVQKCEISPEHNDQRLVHGILKVYANYLGLIDKSQRDKLTNLYNRETLNEQITKILVSHSEELSDLTSSPNDSRRRQYAIKHWLGVIDIDHFKNINDQYGHLYGDEVLILVARLMTSGAIRDDDLVYRFGGEEFVVLLKAANEKDATIAFERLRLLVAEHDFPQLDKVTVSIGFVEIATQMSPSDVIGQADDALYYSKHHGRDQVNCYHRLVVDEKIKLSQQTYMDSVELF